jgi:hypothetical protein
MKRVSIHGDGLYDFYKSTMKKIINIPQAFHVPTRLNQSARSILQRIGDEQIVNITVCRTPVNSTVQLALNAVSLGQFKQRIDNSPYDDIFHLYLVVKTSSTTVTLEKNAIIEISEVSGTFSRPNSDCRNIPIRQGLTLKEILTKTEQFMGSKFYTYSANNNNCQTFVLSILRSNQLGTQEDYDFIKQNTRQLFQDDSFLKKVSNSVTRTGAVISSIQLGSGIKSHSISMEKKQNPWVAHLKSESARLGISYSEAIKSPEVKASYIPKPKLVRAPKVKE